MFLITLISKLAFFVMLAACMKEEGCEVTVLAAEGRTHLRIELEIGLSGDAPTAEILKFIDRHNRRVDATMNPSSKP